MTAKDVGNILASVAVSPFVLAYVGLFKVGQVYDRYTKQDLKNKCLRREREHRRRKSLSDCTESRSTEIKKQLLGPLSKTTKPELNQQLQCDFFARLPTEIRLQIYEYLLCDQTYVHIDVLDEKFHIANRKKQFSRAAATNTHAEDGNGADNEENNTAVRNPKRVEHDHASREKGYIIPLLQTCRRMYTETINILYAHNIFNLSLDYNFLNFAISIPTRHLETIRSLLLLLPSPPNYDLGWAVSRGYSWHPTVAMLKRMTGLKKCRFQVLEQHKPRLARQLLSLLWALPNREVFVVDVAVTREAGADLPSDARLKRKRYALREMTEREVVGFVGVDGE